MANYWVKPHLSPSWHIASLRDEGVYLLESGELIKPTDCLIGERVTFPTRSKHQTKWYELNVEPGTSRILGRPEIRESHRPVCILIGGLGRGLGKIYPLFTFVEQFADPLIFMLPGIESPHVEQPTIERVAELCIQSVSLLCPGRRLMAVGESLGGLIALALAQRVHHVVAIDPPLVMKDQWPLWATFSRHEIGSPFLPAPLIHMVIGANPAEAASKSYLYLLDECKNVRLVCGDEPLLPPRPLERSPSLVGETERAYAESRGAAVCMLSAGHNILEDAFDPLCDVLERDLVDPAYCAGHR